MTTTDGLVIRPVTLDDLEALIGIYIDTATHHAAIDPASFHVPARDDIGAKLRQRIERRGPDGEFVAAILDGRMVGLAMIYTEEPPERGSMLHPIRTAEFGVSVVEGQRGKGIGRALIGHLETWAAEHGVEKVILIVAEANVDAIRLYRALGYREYDRIMSKPIVGATTLEGTAR